MRSITSVFFNNYNSSGEQELLESLIIESISIFGQDMQYIPRQIRNFDRLYTEDDQSTYNQAFMIAMYIKSIDGFQGDGNFMSKFGLEIRDQIILTVPRATFNEEIGMITGQPRPNEGDIVFFPLNKKCFQIKSVNKFEIFYQLGALQTWELTCELFEYSDEVFNTGIADVDSMQKNLTTDALDYSWTDEFGNYLVDESGNYFVVDTYNIETIDAAADNDTIMTGGANNFASSGASAFVDFSASNPFSEPV